MDLQIGVPCMVMPFFAWIGKEVGLLRTVLHKPDFF